MFGFLFNRKKPEPKIVPLKPVQVVKKEVPQKKPQKSQKLRYMCNSCGYRFSRAAGIDFNSTCPYCGKRSVTEDATADAQKLIESTKDVDEERFFQNR
ncbi:MAG TPA: hypothetical protein VK158_03485 [Acidobacteriota bacterium]|nr:hypothetical protein [Acidobacteriota bacterium]